MRYAGVCAPALSYDSCLNLELACEQLRAVNPKVWESMWPTNFAENGIFAVASAGADWTGRNNRNLHAPGVFRWDNDLSKMEFYSHDLTSTHDLITCTPGYSIILELLALQVSPEDIYTLLKQISTKSSKSLSQQTTNEDAHASASSTRK